MQIRRTKLVNEAMTHEFPINVIMVSFGTCSLDASIKELMKTRPADWKDILIKQIDAILSYGCQSAHSREVFYDYYREGMAIDVIARKSGITPGRVGQILYYCHRTLCSDLIRGRVLMCIRQPSEDEHADTSRSIHPWPWNVVYDAFGNESQTYVGTMINQYGPDGAVMQFEKELLDVLTSSTVLSKWDLNAFYLYYQEGQSKKIICDAIGMTEYAFDTAIKRTIALLSKGSRPSQLFRGVSPAAAPDSTISKECLYLTQVFPNNNKLRHALQRAGYSTLSAIYDIGFRHTIKIRCIGPKSIETILTALRTYGFDTVDWCNR